MGTYLHLTVFPALNAPLLHFRDEKILPPAQPCLYSFVASSVESTNSLSLSKGVRTYPLHGYTLVISIILITPSHLLHFCWTFMETRHVFSSPWLLQGLRLHC